MKKFASNVSRELRRAYPDRRKLEIECITAVSFVKQEPELLNCPCWIMIINLVAMDMLKAKIPPVKSSPRNDILIPSGGVLLPAPIPGSGHHGGSSGGSSTNSNSSGSGGGDGGGGGGRNGHHKKENDIRNRPKIPIPTSSDDDPYSSVVGGSSKSKDKPPKLPPRDLNIPKPDYDDSMMEDQEPRIKAFFNASRANAKAKAQAQNGKGKDKKYDDPYYCGLRARIPAFVQKALPPRNNNNNISKQKSKQTAPPLEDEEQRAPAVRNGGGDGNNGLYHAHHNIYGQYHGHGYPPPVGGGRYGKSHHNGNGHHPAAAMMWHAKSVDSGMASIHSNPYADPLSIRKMNGGGVGAPMMMMGSGSDKYSWSHNNFESESDMSESIYAPIYGRLPLPMRNPNTFAPAPRAVAFVGDWE